MRVNLVAVSEVLGGAEIFLLELAEALGRAGVDSRLLGASGPVERAARTRGLEVAEIGLGRKLSRRTAAANLSRYGAARRRLHEFVAAQAADDDWTIFQFKWEELLWGGEVGADRVCLLEHGPIPRRLLSVPWAKRRLRVAFAAAAVVTAVSRPAAEAIRGLCGRESVWLPAGVRASSSATAAASWRRRAGDRTLLAYAGRVTREKGVFDVAALAKTRSDLSVAIAGDGPDLERLRRWVDSEGVSDRVLLPGFVDDPQSLLEAADATVLVSTEAGEGRPLTALESLGVGTPVIGLRSSPALGALASEFPSAVRLVESAGTEDLLAAVEAVANAPLEPQSVGTWDETAAVLIQALEDGRAR